MSQLQFRRRLCLVTDIERYSRHTNPEQVDAQQRLTRVMKYACARAGVVWPRSQKQGDGQLIVLRSGLDEAQAVPALVLGLRHGLYETNRDGGLFGRLRLRAALAQGIIATAANGYVGDAVIEACRVVDSPELRGALDDDGLDLVMAVTDDLYHDVVAHDYPGLDRHEFTPLSVAVPAKEFTSRVWLHRPPAGPTPAHHVKVSWSDVGSTAALGAGAAGLGAAGMSVAGMVGRTNTAPTRRAAAPVLGAIVGVFALSDAASAAPHHDASGPSEPVDIDPADLEPTDGRPVTHVDVHLHATFDGQHHSLDIRVDATSHHGDGYPSPHGSDAGDHRTDDHGWHDHPQDGHTYDHHHHVADDHHHVADDHHLPHHH